MTNYLADENPFNLPAPPDWFLTALKDRDRDLVIMTSKLQPVYRLARRTTKSLGLVKAALRDGDTARMVTHRLIPVTSILPTIKWGATVFQWLDDHDVWKVGGVDAAERRLIAQDDARLKQVQRDQDSEADARGASGYLAAKIRTGQMVFTQEPTRGDAPVGQETHNGAHDHRTVARQAEVTSGHP